MSDSEEQAPVAVGEVLAGKYKVERVLGVGGMGVVVAAQHLQLHQTVALKFALPSAMKDAQMVERFLREARAAVRLKSEHVAKVLDVGTLETGAPYMVMEFLDGQDLGAVVLAHGKLPVEAAADYVLQACEALAEAHTLGIIHRDLKPQNLFLTQSVGGAALVKVLDFGISKITSGVDSALTKTTAIMGSPLYMAPEQMRSARNADPRTDIWALGVILYELLTGDVPFSAETMPELCLKVVTDPPRPVSDLRGDVPDGLLAIIGKCLAKEPAQRFQNAAELASALEPFAPASSANAAARARMVLSSSQPRGSLPNITGPFPAQAVTNTNTPITTDAAGKAQAPAKSKMPLFLGIGAVILVLGGVGIGLVVTRAPSGSAPPAGTTTQAAAGTNTAAPSATTTLPATVAAQPPTAPATTASDPAPSGAASSPSASTAATRPGQKPPPGYVPTAPTPTQTATQKPTTELPGTRL